MDLKVNLLGQELANPTILASGIMGVTPMSLQRICEEGAGAVTTKSIGPKPRTGHPNPTVLEWEHGLINAVGLSNSGVDNMLEEVKEAISLCKSPVIASFFAGTTGAAKHGLPQRPHRRG